MALSTLFTGQNAGVTVGTKYKAVANAVATARTTETDAQIVYRTAGTLTKMFAAVRANASSTTTTIRTRKNAGNGNLSVSVSGGATGVFLDTSNTDTVSAGDKFNYEISGHDGTLTDVSHSVLYGTSGKAVSRIAAFVAGTTVNATLYLSLGGTVEPYIANTTSEAQAQYTAKYSGTASNLFANVISNASTTATVRFRKNGGNGNQTFTITASSTGFFEDTSNTDTFTSGDTIDYSYARGDTGATTAWIGANIEDSSTSKYVAMGQSDEFNHAATDIWYAFAGGTQSVESPSGQNSMQQSAIGSNLQVSVRNNGGNGTTTIISRKNTANGAMSVSITAGSTGIFTDDSNTDTLAIDDEYGTKWSENGSSGLLDQNFIAFVVADTTVTSSIKTFNGLANASTKTVNGLANASVKTWDGVANS